MEPNPGPINRGCKPLVTVTYNVRGLGDERKLRHLLNYMQQRKGGKTSDFISYIEKDGKIPFIWRGNYFLTPGNGHSCDCLTLLSPHLNVIASRDLSNRGHVLVCQKTGGIGNSYQGTQVSVPCSYIVANIYAPNVNSNAKLDFFENVFDTVSELQETYHCQNALILGDSNLAFKESETKNRLFTAQERRVTTFVRDNIVELGMADVLDNKSGFSWRRVVQGTSCQVKQ